MRSPLSSTSFPSPSEPPRRTLTLFVGLSALLHASLWWGRDWFRPPEETLPQPVSAIEVSLVATPASVASQTQSPMISKPAEVSPSPTAQLKELQKPKPTPTSKPKPKSKPIATQTPTEPETTAELPRPSPPPSTATAGPASNPEAPGHETRPQTQGKASASDFEGPKPASHMNNPKPAYPSIAIRRQWEGKVSLKVFVRADGRVGEVLIAVSSGHDVLDEAAVEAVRQWRFVPAKRGGQAVDSWVTFPINWNLENSR